MCTSNNQCCYKILASQMLSINFWTLFVRSPWTLHMFIKQFPIVPCPAKHTNVLTVPDQRGYSVSRPCTTSVHICISRKCLNVLLQNWFAKPQFLHSEIPMLEDKLCTVCTLPLKLIIWLSEFSNFTMLANNLILYSMYIVTGHNDIASNLTC